jgi:hypothetical protein
LPTLLPASSTAKRLRQLPLRGAVTAHRPDRVLAHERDPAADRRHRRISPVPNKKPEVRAVSRDYIEIGPAMLLHRAREHDFSRRDRWSSTARAGHAQHQRDTRHRNSNDTHDQQQTAHHGASLHAEG